MVDDLEVERIVIAFPGDHPQELVGLVRSLRSKDVQVDIIPRLYEVVGSNAGVNTVAGLPFVGLRPVRLSRSALLLKRTLDLAVSFIALVLLAPLFAFAAIAIKRDSPGPVLFRQPRVGSGDRVFEMIKFRTMVADAERRKREVSHLNEHSLTGDTRMFKVRDDPRVTPVGHFLRRYSLDELPQLINVLRGEMSLVGPRPLVRDEDEHVNSWGRRRLEVRPGITGLWQVQGRSDIPFEEMVSLDYLYVTTWSFANDCRLIGRTIPLMLRGQSY
jgi:exopolysaccharide biosynthesis polyprenyl glycosylphosphotransferase